MYFYSTFLTLHTYITKLEIKGRICRDLLMTN
nr:MAG TPA: hypothetical protein [Caudoviricetes sp.]DAZ83619.1 MAG TPA: hypothetical protein [Caudoviricetes sp.]